MSCSNERNIRRRALHKSSRVFIVSSHVNGRPKWKLGCVIVTIFRGFKQNTNITQHKCSVPNLFSCHFEQHIVFGMTAILVWIIRDIPKEIENQVKRENVLAHEALRSADQYDAGVDTSCNYHIVVWTIWTVWTITRVCIYKLNGFYLSFNENAQ